MTADSIFAKSTSLLLIKREIIQNHKQEIWLIESENVKIIKSTPSRRDAGHDGTRDGMND